MRKLLALVFIVMVCVAMSGCATTPTERKAPCGNFATSCGVKTKINNW